MTDARHRDLARWQIAYDRARCAGRPWLLAHKLSRMAASPLAFLRGALPMYHRMLADAPSLADGAAGEGWTVGDLHLENFGAFRAGRGEGDRVTFDVNDFDEAVEAPWRVDLVRALASVVLGAREVGVPGVASLELAWSFAAAWRAQLFDGGDLPESGVVARFVARVERRTRAELLAARTEVVRGRRRFVRGERYRELDGGARDAMARAFERYADALPDDARGPRDALAVEDVAFRVAGTGSLGALRVAVLTRGKGGDDGHWVFDMKEEGAPAAAAVAGAGDARGARRVLHALDACLEAPPRMVGVSEHAGVSLLVRRLSPQDDKLDLARVERAELDALARHLGALAGRACRRGAKELPPPWSSGELEATLDRALDVAAAHQAAWLALCAELRRAPPATS